MNGATIKTEEMVFLILISELEGWLLQLLIFKLEYPVPLLVIYDSRKAQS